jgi:hypothetical protein
VLGRCRHGNEYKVENFLTCRETVIVSRLTDLRSLEFHHEEQGIHQFFFSVVNVTYFV